MKYYLLPKLCGFTLIQANKFLERDFCIVACNISFNKYENCEPMLPETEQYIKILKSQIHSTIVLILVGIPRK